MNTSTERLNRVSSAPLMDKLSAWLEGRARAQYPDDACLQAASNAGGYRSLTALLLQKLYRLDPVAAEEFVTQYDDQEEDRT